MAKKETKDHKQTIIEAFIDHVLTENQYPSSAYILCKKIDIKESEFYNHFSSIEQINFDIWSGFLEETIERIIAEKVYQEYSMREKLLVFYYTLIEVLKDNRSFIQFSFKQDCIKQFKPVFLRKFKEGYMEWIEDLILEGRESHEVAERLSFITDRYGKAFWIQCVSVINFWSKDYSEEFERTDVYIEKAVNFSMDLVNKNLFDSVIDFARFMFQK